MKKTLFIIFLLFFVVGAHKALADAWWGKGYREPAWVIANGGALIYYRVENAKSKPLVKLFTAGGHAVERERGSSGVFDDALPGTEYYLTGQKKEGGSKFKSKVFVLQSGSTNSAVFDFKKKKISISLGGSKRATSAQRKKISQALSRRAVALSAPFPAVKPYQATLINQNKLKPVYEIDRPKLPVYWEDDFVTMFWYPRDY